MRALGILVIAIAAIALLAVAAELPSLNRYQKISRM